MYPFLSVVDQVTIIKQGVEQLQPVIICLLKGKELKHWLPLGWRHWLLGGRSRKKTFPCVLFFITLEFVRVIVHIKIKHLKKYIQDNSPVYFSVALIFVITITANGPEFFILKCVYCNRQMFSNSKQQQLPP